MLEDGWPLQESWQVNPLCLSTLLREEHMDMVILDVGGDRFRFRKPPLNSQKTRKM